MRNVYLSKVLLFIVLLASSIFTLANAHNDSHDGPEVIPVMVKDLADISGKEVLMITVNYKPGEVEVPHRHDAHCFLYVLEGEVIMGLQGGKEVTVKAGQSFYEGPNDIHTVGRNASKTKPAKFLVLLLKNEGVDAVLPVK